VIPEEPLDLIDQVSAQYLDANRDVATMRQRDAQVAMAWHMTTELAAAADGMLRAWRVPLVQRKQMAVHLLEQAFGTPEGRLGAEMAGELARAEQQRQDWETLMRLMVTPDPSEVEVLGQRFRYVGREWIDVDTPDKKA
jgi:hypothetical protein